MFIHVCDFKNMLFSKIITLLFVGARIINIVKVIELHYSFIFFRFYIIIKSIKQHHYLFESQCSWNLWVTLSEDCSHKRYLKCFQRNHAQNLSNNYFYYKFDEKILICLSRENSFLLGSFYDNVLYIFKDTDGNSSLRALIQLFGGVLLGSLATLVMVFITNKRNQSTQNSHK